MKHYLDDCKFQKFIRHFEFLFSSIKESHGELDLRLRDNYFNIYYQGNSLAKVHCKRETYQIDIHKDFANNVFDHDERFNGTAKKEGKYLKFELYSHLLHPFFQKKYLNKISSNIKNLNYGEEITYEQILITDNIEREDFFIIDRQVVEKPIRLDLLALKQCQGNKYHFLLIEIKLGNNPELKNKVGAQLVRYVKHISKYFTEWKRCYEKYYLQIKQTGIFGKPTFKIIEITNEIKGLVVVCGYSGIGNRSIQELRKSYPDIELRQLTLKL